MYDGFADTWEGWGRSLDLKDASSAGQLWADMGLLLGVQGLPLPVLLAGLPFLGAGLPPTAVILLGLNGFLFAVRVALCAAIAPSYDLSQARAKWAFWLSPLADPLAVLRLWISATRRPARWRGRIYTDGN
jgi:dolichol-phosphate mannosyltransferase